MSRFLNSPYFLLALASIIWGATSPIMKLTLTQIPPFSLAFIRMAAASLILLIIIRKIPKFEKKDTKIIIFAALFGVTIHLSFYFFGLKFTQAIMASFLAPSVPILTLFAAHIYLREKPKIRLILAAIIAAAGLLIIIGNPFDNFNLVRAIGGFLLLLASVSWVAHEIIVKKLLKNYDYNLIVFYTMGFGAISLIPFVIFDLLTSPNWFLNVTGKSVFGIIFGILFASLIAYRSWQKGLSKLPVGEASFFFYLDPISSVFFSFLILGEKLTLNLLIGGVLIFLGVLLAEYHRKYHPLHKN